MFADRWRPALTPDAFDAAHRELDAADAALHAGNTGRARVCARRAVAAACLVAAGGDSTLSAMDQLQHLQQGPQWPQHVREAARRLATSVRDGPHAPVSAQPGQDARIIVEHLLTQHRHHERLEPGR